jgi:hypothetical protein
MLLLDDGRAAERRAAVRGPLAPLFHSLTSELEPVLGRELFIPKQKALLSRAGGRCERDGTTLDFDPFSPKSHRCPVCGTSYEGELHERAWNTWYHLWLAERALHAALFHWLVGDARHVGFARDVLRAYADVYLEYPNRDNVLGPTRPFFSTYLESIWLLQLCVAADLLESTGDSETADLVRERIAIPSRALITGFNEGHSNRQVWNNAAIIAASLLLKEPDKADQAVRVKNGVAGHLTHALLPDGTWFEGDNYHQFAIRGLWYAVAMCDANGIDLSADQRKAFDRGIVATFASALPDFTFPSRKDSQYAVSLRQWRFAELAELGFARTRSAQLGGALARCYEPGHEKRDTGRSRSTADAERNVASSLLTRADLGWRALLHAEPDVPAFKPFEPKSLHLMGQGLAIFRRPGQVYAALDYGQSGAGHGHPDRLNLLLAQGTTRWLDDLGTGSYVDKSLHWYRSSLAHNAPFVNGRSQRGANGILTAYDERGDLGWIEAQFVDGDVKLTRTLVVASGYVIDEVAWAAPPDTQVDIPFHVDAKPDHIVLSPTRLTGGRGLEDGFDFVKDWRAGAIAARDAVRLVAVEGGKQLTVTLVSKTAATMIRADAPGQPASRISPFYMVRLHGGQGWLRSVIAWDPDIGAPQFDGDRIGVHSSTRRDVHSRAASGWRVDTTVDRATKVIDLAGRVSPVVVKRPEPTRRERLSLARHQRVDKTDWSWDAMDFHFAQNDNLVIELGERNYRRSEESWSEAGSPTANVVVGATKGWVDVVVEVHAKEQRFLPASATNPLDNEHADTMSAGVQLYATDSRGRAMWSLVPEPGGEHVRIREIPGSAKANVVARWRAHSDGYDMHIHFDLHGDELALDVVINDAVAGRERRRGQLVTHDVLGEFVYLRGDREDESRSVHLKISG